MKTQCTIFLSFSSSYSNKSIQSVPLLSENTVYNFLGFSNSYSDKSIQSVPHLSENTGYNFPNSKFFLIFSSKSCDYVAPLNETQCRKSFIQSFSNSDKSFQSVPLLSENTVHNFPNSKFF